MADRGVQGAGGASRGRDSCAGRAVQFNAPRSIRMRHEWVRTYLRAYPVGGERDEAVGGVAGFSGIVGRGE